MQIIVHESGMVNIDIKDILAYANIRNMYTESRNGAGLQLDENLAEKRDDIGDILDALSSLIYKLQDITKSA